MKLLSKKKARIQLFLEKLMRANPDNAASARSEFTIHKLKETASHLNLSKSYSKRQLIDNIRSQATGTLHLVQVAREEEEEN